MIPGATGLLTAAIAAAAGAMALAVEPREASRGSAIGSPQDAPVAEDEAPSAEPASAELLQRLLDEYAAAVKSKDGAAVRAALVRMRPHDNAELAEPALDALRYRASPVDKKAARQELEELGLDGRSELQARLFLREAQVRAAGARLLANLPPEVGAKALAKTLRDKQNAKERPLLIAATIDALGRLGDRSVEGEVEDFFKAYKDEQINRAAVLYFGRVKTTDLGIVLMLCDELAAPEPASVDSAANPPAGYWELRWKMWMAVRRDVSWALKEITGQVFQPSEGEHESDAKKARDWVKEHARELGLR